MPSMRLNGIQEVEVNNAQITVVSKGTTGALTTAIATATPTVTPALDFGSTLTSKVLRVRARYNQPVTVEFLHGTSATVASNPVQETVTVAANEVKMMEFPIVARYGGLRVTNKGTAATTTHELLYAHFSH